MADAKTPDGQTPAEETVCDPLSGAQFGLCNAYCEAMDCDSDEPQASEKACLKVYDNFLKHSNVIVPPCLCFPDCGIEAQECENDTLKNPRVREFCQVNCATAPTAPNRRVCFEACLVSEVRRICSTPFEACNEECYNDEPTPDS